MTLEMLFTAIAALAAIVGIAVNLYNAHKKGADDQAKNAGDRSSANTKLEFIANDVKEIKADIRELRNNEKLLAEHAHRLTALENRLEAMERRGTNDT